MCGICGYWTSASGFEATLESATARLSHRGPDHRDTLVLDGGRLGLGHTRLSIIDLDVRASQPMVDDRGNALVFNGEIYNHEELRSSQVKNGVRFRTTSDTEVLLSLLATQGLDCLDQVHGMFAFVFWNAARAELSLVRDRFGVKPLYYTLLPGGAAFASEVKSLFCFPLTRDPDPIVVEEYLRAGYVPPTKSIFRGVEQVAPGSAVTFTRTGEPRRHFFWTIGAPSTEGDEPTTTELRNALVDGFTRRLVADVPVGIFLSGGLDSTLVAAVLKLECGIDIDTFTVEFDDARANEGPAAHDTARRLGTSHHRLPYRVADLAEDFLQVVETFDEPLADPSVLPTLAVSKAARTNVKVALSGDGADELFLGYRTYAQFARLWRWKGRVARLRMAEVVARSLDGVIGDRFATTNLAARATKVAAALRAPSPVDAYRQLMAVWTHREFEQYACVRGRAAARASDRVVVSSASADQALAELRPHDLTGYLPGNILTKVDRCSMAFGLEVREPYLDVRIHEVAMRCGPNALIVDGNGKDPLRRLLHEYLPQNHAPRPKQGFVPPMAEWLRTHLRGPVETHLHPRALESVGFFDGRAWDELIRPFLDGADVHPRKVWSMLALQAWASRWLA